MPCAVQSNLAGFNVRGSAFASALTAVIVSAGSAECVAEYGDLADIESYAFTVESRVLRGVFARRLVVAAQLASRNGPGFDLKDVVNGFIDSIEATFPERLEAAWEAAQEVTAAIFRSKQQRSLKNLGVGEIVINPRRDKALATFRDKARQYAKCACVGDIRTAFPLLEDTEQMRELTATPGVKPVGTLNLHRLQPVLICGDNKTISLVLNQETENPSVFSIVSERHYCPTEKQALRSWPNFIPACKLPKPKRKRTEFKSIS